MFKKVLLMNKWDSFGERALDSSQPRAATIRATNFV